MTLVSPRFGQMNYITETHVKWWITVIKAGLQVADQSSLFLFFLFFALLRLGLFSAGEKSSSCVNSASVHVGKQRRQVSPK